MLEQMDASLSILNDPQKLLNVATSYRRDRPEKNDSLEIGREIDTRHEALRALLKLQREKWHLFEITKTEAIDHVYVQQLTSNSTSITLLAPPTRFANRKAHEGDYWTMEKMTFSREGRLIGREPYNQ